MKANGADRKAFNHSHISPDLLPGIGHTKIAENHLTRLAVVYVRQSTPRQVIEHSESTRLQYQLSERAEQYGWRKDRILTIDDDLGVSGRTAEDRLGFQKLLAEVGLNHVGIVLGIEMSRLARSCKDWHQLLELCALFQCLLADQDGLYDPSDYNDRLLLGLKGTMSEAELHILRGRMLQGSRNKARRGELITHLPIGYFRTPNDDVVLDPDEQVQTVVRLVFQKFEELRTAMAVLRYLREHDIKLPVRPKSGPRKGQLEWRPSVYSTVAFMLRNPTYAGAYTHGRYQQNPCRKLSGKPDSGRFHAPMEDWLVLIQDKLPAYITWEQYLSNTEQMRQNRSQFDTDGSPRDGNALLSGILRCGRCGRRFTAHYKKNPNNTSYICPGSYPHTPSSRCQRLIARSVDQLVTQQVLEVIKPGSLQLSLDASQSIRHERKQLHLHWRQRLERSGFETDRARRQFDAVEPENRLVARELERRWEKSLTAQRQLEEEYNRFQSDEPKAISKAEQKQIESLASDLPRIWNADTTRHADRKTIVRHLIDQVVIDVQGTTELVDVTVHWNGGFTSQHRVVRPIARYEDLHNFEELKARVIELWRAGCSTPVIASTLNGEGFKTACLCKPFSRSMVRILLDKWGQTEPKRAQISSELASLGEHEWWLVDLSHKLDIANSTLARWCRRGWMHARKLNGKCRWWVVWADDEECQRLRDLFAFGRGKSSNGNRYPVELRTPKKRPTPPSSPKATSP